MKIISRVYRFYADGFRNMTVGKSLWLLILIKVVIIFGILKLFFFPDVVSQKTDRPGNESQTVRTEILNRQ